MVAWMDYPLQLGSRAVYLLDSPVGPEYHQLDLHLVLLPRTIRHPRT
jgi:hypothetical protein